MIVVAPVLCILSDNPRASELLNHQGGAANLYCRICQVSGCNFSVITQIGQFMQVDKHVNPNQISTLRDKEVSMSEMADIQAAASELD